MIGSTIRATAVRFLAVLALLTTAALSASAQPPCPPGAVTKTVVKKMIYNGVCCDVEVTYCYVPGSTPFNVTLLDATVVDISCWGLAPGSPPPFTENYFVTYIRDLVIRDAYPGIIPNCPTMLNVIIEFKTSTCAELKFRVVDLDGPGPEPEVGQLYLSWCTDVICVRECQVCVNTNDLDPCTSEPRLYFQCAPYYNPGCPNLPQPTNCTNLCGS